MLTKTNNDYYVKAEGKLRKIEGIIDYNIYNMKHKLNGLVPLEFTRQYTNDNTLLFKIAIIVEDGSIVGCFYLNILNMTNLIHPCAFKESIIEKLISKDIQPNDELIDCFINKYNKIQDAILKSIENVAKTYNL